MLNLFYQHVVIEEQLSFESLSYYEVEPDDRLKHAYIRQHLSGLQHLGQLRDGIMYISFEIGLCRIMWSPYLKVDGTRSCVGSVQRCSKTLNYKDSGHRYLQGHQSILLILKPALLSYIWWNRTQICTSKVSFYHVTN